MIGVFIKIHATIKEPRCDCRATDTDVIGVSFRHVIEISVQAMIQM